MARSAGSKHAKQRTRIATSIEIGSTMDTVSCSLLVTVIDGWLANK